MNTSPNIAPLHLARQFRGASWLSFSIEDRASQVDTMLKRKPDRACIRTGAAAWCDMRAGFAMAGLLVIQMLLTACSGILSSEQPAQQTYLLEPVSLSAAKSSVKGQAALVLVLDAVPGLDTNRIQALDADARLNQYANARWPDFIPEVLTSVIRRSLFSSGRFSTITSGSSVLPDSWILDLEVQQFYGVQMIRGSTARVSAVIGGSLRCLEQDYRVDVSSSIPVGEERLSVVVQAHQQALDDVTRQLWDKIEYHCEN